MLRRLAGCSLGTRLVGVKDAQSWVKTLSQSALAATGGEAVIQQPPPPPAGAATAGKSSNA